jgi:hypothetical protein
MSVGVVTGAAQAATLPANPPTAITTLPGVAPALLTAGILPSVSGVGAKQVVVGAITSKALKVVWSFPNTGVKPAGVTHTGTLTLSRTVKGKVHKISLANFTVSLKNKNVTAYVAALKARIVVFSMSGIVVKSKVALHGHVAMHATGVLAIASKSVANALGAALGFTKNPFTAGEKLATGSVWIYTA